MEAEQTVLAEQFSKISKEDEEFASKCMQLSSSICSEQLTILELVEQLGPLLVNPNPEQREKGMLVLSNVLQNLTYDLLPATHLSSIFQFYTDRLNDHHEVIPAVLKGLIPLVQFKNIPDGAVMRLLIGLFENVPCQQQQQNDRNCIYQFFKIVLDKRKEEVEKMGLNFVIGIISAMDGERDPRNLMLLFDWLPHFLRTVDLGHLTEEMFEVIACYFPVDFRAPPQDPNSISRDDLAKALNPCLCAIPSFSIYCIPLILEKLDSELQVAKLDSLNLLIDSCSIFPEDIYIVHSSQIWSLLQKQIINCRDPEIKTQSLSALTYYIKKLSLSDSSIFLQILKDITDTVKGNLRPDAKLFEPSSKILISIAQASEKSAEFIIKEIMPLLVNLYNITTTPDHQVWVFNVLIQFVKAYLSWHKNINLNEVEDLIVAPSLCLKATLHHNQLLVTAGFEGFKVIAEYLPEQIRQHLYKILSNMLLTNCPSDMRNSILGCFKVLAQTYKAEVLKLIEDIKPNDMESLQLYLQAISYTANLEDFTEPILHIITVHSFNNKSSSHIALQVLKDLLENNNLKMQTYLLEREKIFDKLVNWFLDTRLKEVCPVLSLILGNLNAESQKILIEKHLEKIVTMFKQDTDVVLLLHSLLYRKRPEVNINNCDFIENLTDICLETDSLHINEIGAQLLGNIVNKETDESKLKQYVNDIEFRCTKIFANVNKNDQLMEKLVNLMSFVTKGLIMKNQQLGIVLVHKLLEMTRTYALAAKGFKIIISDSCDAFSVRSYCIRSLLYKQKIFNYVTTLLCEKYDSENDNYLFVLGYLLMEVPKDVLHLELKKLIYLLMMCLDKIQEPEVLCAVLSAICDLLKEQDPIIDNYFQEFLTRALTLSKFKYSMKVRILALKCINLYTYYAQYRLLPFRDEVLLTLGNSLDDRKRLVRKEAVETRSAWFLVGAPI